MQTLLEIQNKICQCGSESKEQDTPVLWFRSSCIASSAQGTLAVLVLVSKRVTNIIRLIKLDVRSLLFKIPLKKCKGLKTKPAKTKAGSADIAEESSEAG